MKYKENFIPQINNLFCFFLLFFFIFFPPDNSVADERSVPYSYPGVIHIHSNVSQGGIYSLRELTNLARDKGIKILVFSDSFLKRWEYGLPALEARSVVKYGIRNYLNALKNLRDEFPDMLILEGVEVAPYYWWSGNFFKKNLVLNDWDRHLLVVGLKKPQDYASLPVRGSRYFLPKLKDMPLLLILAALILTGIFILKRRQRKFTGLAFTGLALSVLGALLLFNLFPFSASKYNHYRGPKEFLPYQDLIDYVNKKGGLTFWAHPQITASVSWGGFAGIGFYTFDYPEALTQTSGYTGFGVNMSPGASHHLILAAGQWDKALINYCQGNIAHPVWAIAEADYRGPGNIDVTQNIFLLPNLKQDAALEALRKGKLYLRYYSENNIDISLSDFHIEDSQKPDRKPAFIADELEIKGKPKLYIKGSYKINPAEDLSIEIIRNGAIIQKLRFGNEGVFDSEFQDNTLAVSSQKSYYRLNFFAGDKLILITNPIFIKVKHE